MQPLLHLILYAFFLTEGQNACVSPIITAASGQSVESISLSWLDFGNEPGTLFALEILPAGSTPTGVPSVDSIAGINTVVTGLQSGTEYDIYIRAICSEGPSAWNGPVKATTFIINDSSCGITLNIPDDNCPEFRSFAISVTGYDSLLLGTDLFISSVDLIVEHPWMADLSFILRSPSGASALLMANKGVGVQSIGNPEDTTCSQVLSLSMSACNTLQGIHNAQTGQFVPDASLNVFHDQTNADGTWYLDICDKASDDAGQLRYVRLHFTENACDFPPTIATYQVLDTIATVIGLGDESCDTILLHVWNSNGGDTSELFIPCVTDTMRISQLIPGQSYFYSAQKVCGGHLSGWTCPELIVTTCEEISLRSDFENTALCIADCASQCPLSDTLWTNTLNDDADWIAYQGETATEFTGPDGARFTGGKYLYTETSDDACQNGTESILLSRCLMISGSEVGCDLSFWYHMYGSATGDLILEISVDGGGIWQELWHLQGDQGNAWQEASIDLFAFNDTLATLRFRAVSGPGFLGDIAIDDIRFFGTTDGTGIERCYYLDADGDTYGDAQSTICACALIPPAGYTTNAADCDDTDSAISPDAPELPCNLKDDNCNGEVDEGINPDPVTYALVLEQDASCTGINDGQIEINATGGAAPFTFEWNNDADSSFIRDLSPGFYQCTITDANGCVAVTEQFEIRALIVVEYFVVAASDPSCIGQSDGFISGILQGGTEPYTFMWSNGDTTQDIINLTDGVYQVTVTDAQGCWLISDPIELAASSTISVNILQYRNVTCHGGNNGLIRLVASGGAVPPFSYQWSHGDTTALAENLTAGTYTCTIRDSLGCMLVAGPYHISEPSALEVQVISAIPPLCNSSDDGSIQLSVNGGTPPYFYTWSHGVFSEDVFDLTAGEYSVTVADIHGCDTIMHISLISPDMLQAVLDTVIDVQCPGDSTGTIVLNAAGGTPPYRFDWSTGTSDSAVINNLPTGTYAVTLSDASGCKSAIRDIGIIALNAPLEISYDSIQHVVCHGDSTGFIVASVTGGTAPFWFNWSSGVLHQSIDGKDTLNALSFGSYRVTITDNYGCIGTSGNIPIDEPDRLAFVLDDLMQNACHNDSLGAINISVSGGTSPYTYTWSHGATEEDIAELPAGTYTLTVTDSLGCTINTQSFEITEPDTFIVDVETSNELGMLSNGWALVTPSGGTPPYTYQWDTLAGSQTTTFATDLASATYTVTITDDAGCAYVISVFVDRTTSVVEEEDARIKIYPNPAQDWVIIESDVQIESLSIYSLDGREHNVLKDTLTFYVTRMRITDLPAGIFLLRVNEAWIKIIIE